MFSQVQLKELCTNVHMDVCCLHISRGLLGWVMASPMSVWTKGGQALLEPNYVPPQGSPKGV